MVGFFAGFFGESSYLLSYISCVCWQSSFFVVRFVSSLPFCFRDGSDLKLPN